MKRVAKAITHFLSLIVFAKLSIYNVLGFEYASDTQPFYIRQILRSSYLQLIQRPVILKNLENSQKTFMVESTKISISLSSISL